MNSNAVNSIMTNSRECLGELLNSTQCKSIKTSYEKNINITNITISQFDRLSTRKMSLVTLTDRLIIFAFKSKLDYCGATRC